MINKHLKDNQNHKSPNWSPIKITRFVLIWKSDLHCKCIKQFKFKTLKTYFRTGKIKKAVSIYHSLHRKHQDPWTAKPRRFSVHRSCLIETWMVNLAVVGWEAANSQYSLPKGRTRAPFQTICLTRMDLSRLQQEINTALPRYRGLHRSILESEIAVIKKVMNGKPNWQLPRNFDW